jgi:release factor glutamine methyltransferase
VTIQTALLQGVKLLEDARISAPRLTAEVLLSHALNHQRPYLYAHPEQELREIEWIHYGRYLHERLNGKPTQYITGKQEFYGRDFRVTSDVLIPRPETEHVVDTVVKLNAANIVDAGCGSGAIAITLALETRAAVCATDISTPALLVASDNAQTLHAPVQLIACDLLSAIASASMDVVVSNPPYVPAAEKNKLQREVRDWEPALALFSGPTGFEIYERLGEDAGRVLRPGGWLVMELGFGSLGTVRGMLEGGWQQIQTVDDLAGIPRVLACQKK